jgi:catalase (peroxidase I)
MGAHAKSSAVPRRAGSVVCGALGREHQLWQDPVPPLDHELIGDAEIAVLKAKVLGSECTGRDVRRT